jgi:4-diphosphocytidyl-2C-methyl-D-erythritol kinase
MSGSGATVFALFKEAYEVPSSLTSAVLAKFYL